MKLFFLAVLLPFVWGWLTHFLFERFAVDGLLRELFGFSAGAPEDGEQGGPTEIFFDYQI